MRLKSIEGHFHALHRMVDEERPYTEIVAQLVAVRSSIDAVARVIIGDLSDDCVAGAAPNARSRRAVEELRAVVRSVL